MKHQEDNCIPQTMIIYSNPSDPSIPLQPGTIPQDTIVPGISQEQQKHSKLPKGVWITVSIPQGPTRIPQHPSVQYKTHWEHSRSHIKILNHILKMNLCVEKCMFFNYIFVLYCGTPCTWCVKHYPWVVFVKDSVMALTYMLVLLYLLLIGWHKFIVQFYKVSML